MTAPIDELWGKLVTDGKGLVPCVAQDVRTRAVLMVAWVSKEALARTIETGFAVYFSRSRSTLWEKGAVSGKRQRIVHVRLDTDRDTLLYMVDAELPAGNDGSDTYFNYRHRGRTWVWDPVTLSQDQTEIETADAELTDRAKALALPKDEANSLHIATDLLESVVRTLKLRGLTLRQVLENLEERVQS